MDTIIDIFKEQLKLYEEDIRNLIEEAESISEICSLCTSGKLSETNYYKKKLKSRLSCTYMNYYD